MTRMEAIEKIDEKCLALNLSGEDGALLETGEEAFAVISRRSGSDGARLMDQLFQETITPEEYITLCEAMIEDFQKRLFWRNVEKRLTGRTA